MQDISTTLYQIMDKEQCSPIRAFFLLSEGTDKNGIHQLQSESNQKVGRRLRHSGNFKNVK